MAFCTNCGTKLGEGARFCSGCGTPALSTGSIEIKQENAVNYTQSPPAFSNAPSNYNTLTFQTIKVDEKYCFSCGSPTKRIAKICPKCGVSQDSRNSTMAIDVYCISCGKNIKKEAETCVFCGVIQTVDTDYPTGYIPKNWTTALLFLIFLGGFGGHRFYVGKIGTAILMMVLFVVDISIAISNDVDMEEISFTPGLISFGIFIWCIVDLVRICTGKFMDSKGYPLKRR